MNAVSPLSIAEDGSGPAVERSSMKWGAVHDAGEAVARLAGAMPGSLSEDVLGFPVLLLRAPQWRRECAKTAIDDLMAVMELGIAALLGTSARGGDPRPAALMLWASSPPRAPRSWHCWTSLERTSAAGDVRPLTA
jgi:hypothetical protein